MNHARACACGARSQSSFPRLSSASRNTREAAGASLPTWSWLMISSSIGAGVLMVRDKRNDSSSAQTSETQRTHTSARSRNERARGALFEYERTRRCGSSAMAAMAMRHSSRQTAGFGEMEPVLVKLNRIG
jgi:hypothetical protein